MDKIKQRITIAEACGWTVAWDGQPCGIHPSLHQADDGPITLPDYLNDLNAMHEAEEVLTAKQSSAYWCILQSTGKPWPEKGKGAMFWQSTHATAAQRAEALLKTLNLWEEANDNPSDTTLRNRDC
jgi:hypothetical protein